MNDEDSRQLEVLSGAVGDVADYLFQWPGLSIRYETPDASEWAEEEAFLDPLGVARSHAAVYAMGATHLLRAISVAAPQGPLFAAEVLARSCLEGATVAWWILSASDTKEQVRRALIDRVWSLEQRGKALQVVKERAAQEEASKLKAKADALQEHGQQKELLKPRETAASARNLSDLTGKLLSAHSSAKFSPGLAYRHLTGFSHLNPLSVLGRRNDALSAVDETGTGHVLIESSLVHLSTTLYIAVVACETMASAIAAVTGESLNELPFRTADTQYSLIMNRGESEDGG